MKSLPNEADHKEARTFPWGNGGFLAGGAHKLSGVSLAWGRTYVLCVNTLLNRYLVGCFMLHKYVETEVSRFRFTISKGGMTFEM